jgi:hypothetical protein
MHRREKRSRLAAMRSPPGKRTRLRQHLRPPSGQRMPATSFSSIGVVYWALTPFSISPPLARRSNCAVGKVSRHAPTCRPAASPPSPGPAGLQRHWASEPAPGVRLDFAGFREAARGRAFTRGCLGTALSGARARLLARAPAHALCTGNTQAPSELLSTP